MQGSLLKELEKALQVGAKLQVTVWDPADDSIEHVFPSFVKESAGLLFRMAPPSAAQMNKIGSLMGNECMIGVVLETYPNPYIFYPMLFAQPGRSQDGYWVRIAEDTQIEVIQRRRHVRIPMIVPLELEYQLGNKWISMAARTEDVSGGGMRFTSIKLFTKGQNLRLHLQLNPADVIMHIDATVVFSTENRVLKQPDDLYATACQFAPLEDAQEMLIVRECFRRELKQKQ